MLIYWNILVNIRVRISGGIENKSIHFILLTKEP